MRLAQNLYESGHITYMRTDSTNLSGEALGMVRGYIEEEFGKRYLPEKPNFYSSSNKSRRKHTKRFGQPMQNFRPVKHRKSWGRMNTSCIN